MVLSNSLENMIISHKLHLHTFATSIYILKQWKYFKGIDLDTSFYFFYQLGFRTLMDFGGSTKAGFAKLNKFNVATWFIYWKQPIAYIIH